MNIFLKVPMNVMKFSDKSDFQKGHFSKLLAKMILRIILSMHTSTRPLSTIG